MMAADSSKFRRRRRREEKAFFCQVETYFGTKEYARHGRCVRLIGIDESDFHSLINDGKDGVTTYVIDLDFWRYFRQQLGLTRWWEVMGQLAKIKDLETQYLRSRQWFRVDIEVRKSSADYYYPTFSMDGPTYIDIIRVEPVSADDARLPSGGIQLQARPCTSKMGAFVSQPLTSVKAFTGTRYQHGSAGTVNRSAPYTFHAFHVGQGMCSLIDNGRKGWLLDAGAGKPVTRKRYLDKSNIMSNDLTAKVQPLTDLVMVASHTDYDHWKLLAWDAGLRKKVSAILVPAGVSHLLFKDKEVISKCVDTSSTTITLAANTSLELIRANPSTLDSNGNCIVAVFVRDGQRVLAPGDYVYSRFASDSSPRVKDLHKQRYKAVIVPHHGDKESANNVVTAHSPRAHAFFSAGTHGYYKHPTKESRDEHKAAQFVELCDETKDDIKAVLLL